MAWSTPLTAVSTTALTAAQWNASVRDNLLETGPAKVSAAGQILVSTGLNALAARTIGHQENLNADTTTSTTYGDLSGGSGPGVTVTTGANALVAMKVDTVNSGAGSSVMSYAISGATTVAPIDTSGIGSDGTVKQRMGCIEFASGLTPGSNTFTTKYRVTSGTGTFTSRQIFVIPL